MDHLRVHPFCKHQLHLGEHLRFATNPSNPSYKIEAFAAHYDQHHPGQTPDLTFKLMKMNVTQYLEKCTRLC